MMPKGPVGSLPALGLLLLLWLCGPAMGQSSTGPGEKPVDGAAPRLTPGAVPWEHLRFEARKFIFEGTTDIRLELDGAGGPLLGLQSAFAGRSSEVTLWFEPTTGAVFQRVKQRHGRKAYQKIHLFSPGGVWARRASPDRERGEPEDTPAAWTQLDEAFYPHPAEPCPVISEPSLLFYLLSAADLRVGESLELCVFSDKTVQPITVRAVERQSAPVDYREMGRGTPKTRRGDTDIIRMAIEPGDHAESFELMGLSGGVEIDVDPTARLPVRVSGNVPGLGKVDVRLESVGWR